MPIYEYECSACRFYVETLQKISEPQLKKCPSCGKDALHRLISAPVFRLKGAGWYETDFKSDKENKRNLVDTGAEDKEPATAGSDADKKVKVRVSKVLKKVAAKKTADKPAKKVARKSGKPPKAAKGARKPTGNKVTGKATRKRSAKPAKATRKPSRKKVARKK
jgi:putative FmdB family regulatory protein